MKIIQNVSFYNIASEASYVLSNENFDGIFKVKLSL